MFRLCLLFISFQALGQEETVQSRKIHYTPNGQSFVLKHGNRKFNRALYGTNTGFRVEAGDLPEFALYLPGMGGNLKLGITTDNESKWITDCDSIKTVYSPGIVSYTIQDAILNSGTLQVSVVAHANNEALILKLKAENISKDINLIWAFGGATGKKFHRDGDIGADPESVFYQHPNYCLNNVYEIEKNHFQLHFGSESNKQKTGNNKIVLGYFPNSITKIVEANLDKSPLELYNSKLDSLPIFIGETKLSAKQFWKLEYNQKVVKTNQKQLENEFNEAVTKAETLQNRVVLKTPDPYLNTLGGALATAADAIWENPAYLHGAVAWRMYLNAWRGAYVAHPLGWHDRAQTHFKSYGNSQVLEPETGPVVLDSSRNFARQKEVLGTAMFSRGYISRHPNNNTKAHHYDMNSVFINQILRGFQWDGDVAFIKQMWPVIKRHLAWEKRNFDADGDGLYDAYATIWASDALQYSGGGVTYASAYNYSANLKAAKIAEILGENTEPYLKEAKHIKNAIEEQLWMPKNGVYAEYKDLLGSQLLHEKPGIWTVYHALDEAVSSPFQAYQALRYVDTQIPHIPVKATGLPFDDLQVISTSNWQPYTWSVNNVALAENLHMALAYWQGNRNEEAYKLWHNALIESMYLGASPGGFQQLSFYDAVRGELYRDFADPIGMAARSLVEGLFGVNPDAITKMLHIKPGFPTDWKNASLHLPDIDIAFAEVGQVSNYTIVSRFKIPMTLQLQIDAKFDAVEAVKINGKISDYKYDENAVGAPNLIVEAPYSENYNIEITWKGNPIETTKFQYETTLNENIQFSTSQSEILEIYNPQEAVSVVNQSKNKVNFKVTASEGDKTLFVKLKQNDAIWWQPLHIHIKKEEISSKFQNWDDQLPENTNFEMLNLESVFNSKVTEIFEQNYLTPRPTSPTLQLPTQGIGNWCYPYVKPKMDDSGLRKLAGEKNTIVSPQNIPFKTPSNPQKQNIAFVSMWDNFPKSLEIPISGQASHAYFMMAGTTNPMQSRFVNGEIIVTYSDGSTETLQLKNPENWWPIEQDYFVDGLAFTTNAPKPPRVYLKTGQITRDFKDFTPIKGFSNYGVDGGAATLLDLPLNPNKTLQSLTIKAVANDVVIGVMSATLLR
ncbi:glycogen debranching protein [Tamlana nanhaiensis]|uniref:Glycogen debranching protein n=1 Tax=Neotamlana nanhaiensis TaxID=1382798 RepID=A0A0D7W6U1_9FLAO|nr:glycogen debranching protein [Tamlana nanhaiensis]